MYTLMWRIGVELHSTRQVNVIEITPQFIEEEHKVNCGAHTAEDCNGDCRWFSPVSLCISHAG